ncbi:MAG: CopD family protein, partial [Marinomonas sp.]
LLPQEIARLRLLIIYDRFIVAPAMFMAIGSGLFMAINFGWFDYTWLQIKVPLIVILAAIHGVHSGKIKRMTHSSENKVSFNMSKACTTLLSVVISIIALAVFKPF